MPRIKLILDTNVFMATGSGFTFEPILSLLRVNTHVFVYLSCVEKELKKKNSETGLKRLYKILESFDCEGKWDVEVYADENILKFLRTCTESTDFISRDKELLQRVYRLGNSQIHVFRLTKDGYINPYTPQWKPWKPSWTP